MKLTKMSVVFKCLQNVVSATAEQTPVGNIWKATPKLYEAHY